VGGSRGDWAATSRWCMFGALVHPALEDGFERRAEENDGEYDAAREGEHVLEPTIIVGSGGSRGCSGFRHGGYLLRMAVMQSISYNIIRNVSICEP